MARNDITVREFLTLTAEQVDNLEERVSNLQADAAARQAEINALRELLSGLRTEMGIANSAITAVSSENAVLRGQFSAHQSAGKLPPFVVLLLSVGVTVILLSIALTISPNGLSDLVQATLSLPFFGGVNAP